MTGEIYASPDRYALFVKNLQGPLQARPLTKQEEDTFTSILGICDEAGELIDIGYPLIHYGREVDEEHLKEEAGDLLFWLTALCSARGWTLRDIRKHNVHKLRLRYPDGFNIKDAVERKDKLDGEIR